MKQYGIITHYDVHNHGAILQLTALIRVLKRMNIEAKALRFDKNYDFLGHELKAKYDVTIKGASIFIDYLRKQGVKKTLYNFNKRRTLQKFKAENNLIGDFYSEAGKLDGVIVGSDEVFALHTGPTPVFFGHCLPTDHVFSYAGSFGPTTTGEVARLHATAFVKSGLESMSEVTVRDVNSADVVEKLIGKRPEIVVDPVLLYGYEEEIAPLPKPNEGNYLLVYAYDNRMNKPEEVEAIRKYASSRNLKIISTGFYHGWCDQNIDVDPVNLLAYFKHATEVITDTFHGSVMSIITGAKFAVKTRESNHFKLMNLLNEYGLSNRIFTKWTDIAETMNPEINYDKVNNEVEKRRGESMTILSKMIDHE